MAEHPADSSDSRRHSHGAWAIAAIGAGSALLGAVVGAASGYLVAERQIAAAHQTMLREERKGVYIAAIAALSKMDDALKLAEALPVGSPVAKVDAIVCPEYEKTRTTLLSVLLLGDDKVIDYAGNALSAAAASCSTAPHDDGTRSDNPFEGDFDYAFLGVVSAAQEELGDF
jgi:hypothetical protein